VASSASRPLVGVSTYLERTRFGVWDTPSAVLPAGYLDGIVRAGGMPVLLPPVEGWEPDHLSNLDGLIIAGGADVDPSCYAAGREPATGPARPDRDESESELVNLAVKLGIPLLGVCRGMQLLNVVLGGTLHQHLPDRTGTTDHLPAPGTFGRVPVTVAAGSRLAATVGERVEAACHHHQAIDRLGDGVRAVAWADDGTVEGIEVPGEVFAVGVQWHPEVGRDGDDTDRLLFEALVREAR
jgi:putative glutamine amidotransferase